MTFVVLFIFHLKYESLSNVRTSLSVLDLLLYRPPFMLTLSTLQSLTENLLHCKFDHCSLVLLFLSGRSVSLPFPFPGLRRCLNY